MSVVTVTVNSARTLPEWAAAIRAYADEILVVVDDTSNDGTTEVARDVADRVEVVEHPLYGELVFDWALRRTTGDWVLLLADDEVLSSEFSAVAQTLMSDRELTHYSFERRWLVRHGEGCGWLRQYPWYPDVSLRLVRNIGSLFWHPLRVHRSLQVVGAGRTLDESEGSLYHVDLVWRSREQRERKVRERYAGENADFYLHEGIVEAASIVPVTDPAVLRMVALEPSPEPPWDRGAPRRAEGRLLLGDLAAQAQAHSPHITDYGVEFVSHDTPRRLTAGRGCIVRMTLRNASDAAWFTGVARGPVNLCYHISTPNGEVVAFDGFRSPMPRTVLPGEVVTVDASLTAPHEPGEYVVEWDMVQEHVTWFSERGAATLRLPLTAVPAAGQLHEPELSVPDIEGAGGGEPVTGEPPKGTPPIRRRRRPLRALGTAVVLAVGAQVLRAARGRRHAGWRRRSQTPPPRA